LEWRLEWPEQFLVFGLRVNKMQNNRSQWMILAAAAACVMIGIGNADAPKDVQKPSVSVEPKQPEPANSDPVTGHEPDGPTIVMVSLQGCGPCEQWWDQHEKWDAVGWSVQKVYGAPDVTAFPTFRIYHGGEWHQHVGYMTYADARDLLGLDKPRQSARLSSASAKQLPLARGTYDGTSRWTYPGDIATHLMGPQHGFQRAQIAGLSKGELEALHSDHHEQKRAAGVQRVYSSSSSCPGGSCPTQPSRTLRFRRR